MIVVCVLLVLAYTCGIQYLKTFYMLISECYTLYMHVSFRSCTDIKMLLF